jgi:hypothetical protein
MGKRLTFQEKEPMRNTTALLLATLLLPAFCIHAQEKKEEPATYKVEFTLHDGTDADGKAGRRYSMLVSTSGKGVFRVGNRVPYATGSFQPSTGANPLPVTTQYQYFDVGVNIDCSVREASGKINVRADLDVSTVVQHDRSGAAGTAPNPTISQIKMNVDALVNPGKPTVVASIDDPVTMRKFAVDVSVTRAN